MFKIFFAVLSFAAIVVTGGLYLLFRKPDAKKQDLQKATSMASSFMARVRSIWNYATKLFSSKAPAEVSAAAA